MALEITQVKSKNGSKRNQRECLRTLGLRKIRQTVVMPDRPEIRGLVFTVKHLVECREVSDDLLPERFKNAEEA